jgi:hypothetical protein
MSYTIVVTERGQRVLIFPTDILMIEVEGNDTVLVTVLNVPGMSFRVKTLYGGSLATVATQEEALRRAYALRNTKNDESEQPHY